MPSAKMRSFRLIRCVAAQMARLAAARDGAMGIMGSISVVVMIAVSALALQASMLFVTKGDMQRVADLANLAAANTDTPISSGAVSAQALATAQQIATINGYSPSILSTSVTTSSSTSLLTTTAVDAVTLPFAGVLSSAGSVSVRALSSASLASSTAGDCLRTLTGAVNIFSSASVTGTGCTIAAATYFYYCSSATSTVSAVEVAYSSTLEKIYICSSANLTPTLSNFTFNKTSTDSLASDTRITTMKKRLQAMSSWPYSSTFKSPLTPTSVSGGSSLSYSNTTASVSGTKYANVTLQNSTLTFAGTGAADTTCSSPVTITGNLTMSGTSTLVLGSGCYSIKGVVTISNSATVTIKPATGASVTLALQQYLYNGTGSVTFGDMLFSTVGIINNGNGGNVTFGDGPFYLGNGVYNTTGTVTFGDGPFYLSGGSVNNASTGTITFGDGPFYFYYCSLLNYNGVVTLGDGDFQFYGTSLSTYLSSKTTFGEGNLNFYSTPVYVDGAEFTVGGSGDATNGASSMFFYLSGLQIVTGKFTATGTSLGFWYGALTLSGSAIATITAPTASSPTYGYQNILSYTYGASVNIYQNAVTDSLSGIIYNPSNDVNLFGKQTNTIPTSGCFAIVAGYINIYSSSTATMKACGSGTSTTQASLAN